MNFIQSEQYVTALGDELSDLFPDKINVPFHSTVQPTKYPMKMKTKINTYVHPMAQFIIIVLKRGSLMKNN